MSSISPFLWFDTQAEEAAEFYVSLFPNSEITSVQRYPEGAGFPAGTAMAVSFVLDGLRLQALNAGPQYQFTEAISLYVDAPTQERIDELWDALTADGGEPGQCGWLKDKYGLSWQIIPPRLSELLGHPQHGQSVMQAMFGMQKLVIADLEAAAH